MTKDETPTADERAGMDWWNGMDGKAQLDALEVARLHGVADPSAADAWDVRQGRHARRAARRLALCEYIATEVVDLLGELDELRRDVRELGALPTDVRVALRDAAQVLRRCHGRADDYVTKLDAHGVTTPQADEGHPCPDGEHLTLPGRTYCLVCGAELDGEA